MTRTSKEQHERLLGWTLILAVKLVVVVGFHLWSLANGRDGLAPVVIGGDDGEYYLRVAERIADTGSFPFQISSVWPVFIGRVMQATGWRGVLPFKLFLFLSSVGTAIVGVRLLRLLAADLCRRRPGALAEVNLAALLILFPSTLWIASYSIYRDAVIYFLAMVAVYAAYRALVRHERRFLILGAVALGTLVTFRWYAAVAVGAGAVMWLLLSGKRGRMLPRRLAAGSIAVAALLIVVWSGEYGFIRDALSSRDVYDYNQGGSNLGLSYTRSSVLLWPLIYLYTFLTNLIGPLPNQIIGVTTLVGFVLEVPFLAFVLWRVFKSPFRHRPPVQLLLAVVLVWFALIAIYNDNVGTGLRLRIVGYQFLFILAVLDLSMARAQARVNKALAASSRRRPPRFRVAS